MYEWACHDILPSELQLGDHIYVWGSMGIHTHHGIVTHIMDQPSMHRIPLDDRIIVTHFSPVHSSSFPFKNVMDVLRGNGTLSLVYDVPLRDFVGSNPTFGGLKRARYSVPQAEYWVKRAGTCYQERADPAQVALRRAQMLLEEHNRLEQVYSVATAMTANCEHMAFWCKTGIWRSAQTANLPSQILIGAPKMMGGVITNIVANAVTFLDENLPAFPLPVTPQHRQQDVVEEPEATPSDAHVENESSQDSELPLLELEKEENEKMLQVAELFYSECNGPSSVCDIDEESDVSAISDTSNVREASTFSDAIEADALESEYVMANMDDGASSTNEAATPYKAFKHESSIGPPIIDNAQLSEAGDSDDNDGFEVL
eukprot:GEMP01011765.1.p1 GENE.GEMP01011765.1~~GEMP01011765.1.p1  ORF type:complete len:372 (+),score=64.60 GEMP01011765.1:185-1300(+)